MQSKFDKATKYFDDILEKRGFNSEQFELMYYHLLKAAEESNLSEDVVDDYVKDKLAEEIRALGRVKNEIKQVSEARSKWQDKLESEFRQRQNANKRITGLNK